MRLTAILLRWKKPLPHGHLWRGKYRLYKEVTKQDLHQLKLRFDIEEENMFYLRHPYLTVEQSHGHALALGLRKKFREDKIKAKTWGEHRYLGDKFGFLKIQDKWE